MEGGSLVSPVPLSTRDEDVLSRTRTQDVISLPGGVSLEEYYDVSRTAAFISSHGHRCVALQFPDSMLHHCTAVLDALRCGVPREVRIVILGDTSYGSCCVDEVAAEHVSADLIVHYGRSCLSGTTRTPTLFVLGTSSALDPDDFVSKLESTAAELDSTHPEEEREDAPLPLLVVCDSPHACAMERVRAAMAERDGGALLKRVVVSVVPKSTEEMSRMARDDSLCSFMGRFFPIKGIAPGSSIGHARDGGEVPDIECSTHPTSSEDGAVKGEGKEALWRERSFSIVLICQEESPLLPCVVMSAQPRKVYRYSPEERSISMVDGRTAGRQLMRRYYLVQRVKDADVIGIVAGTLGVSRYKEAIEECKKLIVGAGKRYYLLLVGKINEAKLANFEFVDLFVVVACPQNSLIDSKEYYKPIVTPFELRVALHPQSEWTGEFSADFGSVLLGGDDVGGESEDEVSNKRGDGVEDGKDGSDADAPRFSLIDGTLKASLTPSTRGHHEDKSAPFLAGDPTEGALSTQERERRLAEVSPAGAYYSNRIWKGLDPQLGLTPVLDVEEGDSGRSMRYAREKDVGQHRDRSFNDDTPPHEEHGEEGEEEEHGEATHHSSSSTLDACD